MVEHEHVIDVADKFCEAGNGRPSDFARILCKNTITLKNVN